MFTLTSNLNRSTNELEKEQARLESSINSVNVGYIITNEDGEVKTINNAAKAIFCTDEITLHTDPKLATLQCSMTDIATKLQGILDIKAIILTVLTDKKSFKVHNLAYKKLFLNLTFTPIVLLKKQDSLLEFIGSVILIEDVTEEKQLEKSRSDFFSIASHELKTPLAVIKGNVELIRKYFPQKEEMLNNILDDMYESSIRLIDIVNDFLDISHLEQGKIEFRKDRLEIVTLIQIVVKSLQSITNQKGLFIKVINQNPQVFVLADKYRAEQVLINLIDNALKFTTVGGITIQVLELDGHIKINVADTGSGIPIQNQNLVFKKFELASNDTLIRGSNRNTGVGLYISKYLAEGMDGQLKLEYSEEGKGSCFSFTLPKA